MSLKSAERRASSSLAGSSVQVQTPQAPAPTSQIPVATRSIQEETTTCALDSDRVTALSKKNQQLEIDNKQINKQLAECKEVVVTMFNQSRDTEKALAVSQEVMKESAKERERLELETGQLRRDVQEIKEKLDKKTEEAALASQTLGQLDARLHDLTVQNKKLGAEKDQLTKERQECELKLQQSVQELHAQYEAQVCANKEELAGLYEQRNADLLEELKRLQRSSAAKEDAHAALAATCDKLAQQITTIDSEINSLLNKIKDLEEDHQRYANLLLERNNDIDRLVTEKSALMSDYMNLMDTKVALEKEFAAYRKLKEEEKQNTFPPKIVGFQEGTLVGGRRLTPVRAAKRKRDEEDMTESAAEFHTKTVCNGDIEISEDDPEGRFIRVYNKSDKEISLSGWQLIRLSGDFDTTHKFDREVNIDPHSTVTVWSSYATEGVHEPPSDIVMKGQKWYTSRHFKTVLVDSNGDEKAIHETRRLQVSRQKRKRLGFGQTERDEGVEGNGCGIV